MNEVERCLASELAAREKDFATASQWLGSDQEISESAILRLQAARNSGRAGHWAEAAHLLKPLATDEESGELRIRYVRELVDTLDKAQNIPDALAWIARWKQQAPQNLEVWKKEIGIRLRHRAGAIEVLRSAVHRFSNDLELLSQYADVCIQYHHPSDAEVAYWKLYELDKANSLKWIQKLHALEGRYRGMPAHDAEPSSSGIRRRLEQRRASNPNSVEPLIALAELARLDGDIEAQLEHLPYHTEDSTPTTSARFSCHPE